MTKSSSSIKDIFSAAWRAMFAVARFIRRLIPRLYGLGMLVLICWLTFLSIQYLVSSLVVPSQAPDKIVAIPRRMDTQILSTDQSAWEAIAAAETPRMPPAHYHRVDSWIEPDSLNDCTRSGCHGPLPHGRNKAVRAFLNMHATTVHCGVCHMTSETFPLRVTWYDLESGKSQGPPAVLRLFERLTTLTSSDRTAEYTNAEKDELVDLIVAASKDVGGSNTLDELVRHFKAIRASSLGFPRLLNDTLAVLPRFFRGEYGAKLALKNDAGLPILGHPDSEKAVQEFLTAADSIAPETREAILKRVHPRKRETALNCTACHTPDKSEIDFEGLGYPAARIHALSDPVIFQMIEHIDAGRTFEMPTFIAPVGE